MASVARGICRKGGTGTLLMTLALRIHCGFSNKLVSLAGSQAPHIGLDKPVSQSARYHMRS